MHTGKKNIFGKNIFMNISKNPTFLFNLTLISPKERRYMQVFRDVLVRITLLSLLLLFSFSPVFAHALDYDINSLSKTEAGFVYLKMGFTHIIPLGLDHVLFVIGLFFLNPNLKSVIWQATAFTVAHSITLGLSIYGYIQPATSVIEPIIALSILFISIENILITELKWWRILIVFAFGLIHGCGFASVLSEAGLPEKNYLIALLNFNIGVELGQITVILLAFLLIGKWFGKKEWYKKRIVIPASASIGCIALYWTIERAFF
ncbi:MAG TPA: HupE/UreJ family protein [Bacteroidia bacterium]|nr:HupE/UreJ family protein [Bacteroidia bacterium]